MVPYEGGGVDGHGALAGSENPALSHVAGSQDYVGQDWIKENKGGDHEHSLPACLTKGTREPFFSQPKMNCATLATSI